MKTYESCCKAYHALVVEIATHRKSEVPTLMIEELEQEQSRVLTQALRMLGEEMGEEFNLFTSGPLDQRIADVLCKADLLRKTLLDGFGYVNVLDEENSFARGFFGTASLEKNSLFRDLKLCSQHRYNGVVHSQQVMTALGFAGAGQL
jgi:hypothetical protein